MNLQSSSINLFLLNISKTLMQTFAFLFFKKGYKLWVIKNNETILQLWYGHSMIAIAHHQFMGQETQI